MTEQFDFIGELARRVGATEAKDLPEVGGYSQVSWDATKAPAGFGLVRTIAEAIIEKNPSPKHIMFKREYDIDSDDYTRHRVLFW